MIVELHMIQNFTYSCLNRDDNNAPKTCVFGGKRRARISSQCLKASIRKHSAFGQSLKDFMATRSKEHASELARRLHEEDGSKTEETALSVFRLLFQKCGFKEKGVKSSVLLALGPEEANALYEAAKGAWDALVPLANEHQKRTDLETQLVGLLDSVDELRPYARWLAEIIVDHVAGTSGISEIQAWIELQSEAWDKVIDALKKGSPEDFQRVQEAMAAEEEEGDEPQPEAGALKKAKTEWKKRFKGAVEALKTIQPDKAAKKAAKKDTSGLPEAVETAIKAFKKLKTTAADVALFGRMIAEIPNREKDRDAACSVAHAISTHDIGSLEFDFYTAVDEISKSTGASMMGLTEYDSACYYRYSHLDVGQLRNNLGDRAAMAGDVLRAFLRASIEAYPSGKQHASAAFNPPSFVIAIVRRHGAWNLANAFEQPVRADGGRLVEQSVEALLRQLKVLRTDFGDGDLVEIIPLGKPIQPEPSSFEALSGIRVGDEGKGNIDRFIEAVAKAALSA
jgi:CRISPR-associated protein Cas7/Cse4/CasC subtype I-E